MRTRIRAKWTKGKHRDRQARAMEEVKKEAETINVIVRDQQAQEVHFKIKMHTKFSKVFQAFCTKKALAEGSTRFMFDGSRILPEQTPADLDMSDQDVIDAVVEQVGGSKGSL